VKQELAVAYRAEPATTVGGLWGKWFERGARLLVVVMAILLDERVVRIMPGPAGCCG